MNQSWPISITISTLESCMLVRISKRWHSFSTQVPHGLGSLLLTVHTKNALKTITTNTDTQMDMLTRVRRSTLNMVKVLSQGMSLQTTYLWPQQLNSKLNRSISCQSTMPRVWTASSQTVFLGSAHQGFTTDPNNQERISICWSRSWRRIRWSKGPCSLFTLQIGSMRVQVKYNLVAMIKI